MMRFVLTMLLAGFVKWSMYFCPVVESSLEDTLRLTLVKVVPEEVSRHAIPTKR